MMDQPMETEICYNCKREVPQSNYLIHVAHCAKNMAVCPVCGNAVPKAHLKEHREREHSLVECKACRHKVQSGAMEHHRATQCGKRVVACNYCELELPKNEMSDHENYCGSRTERCDECGELVMWKYKKLHVDSNHGFLKLDDEPGPTPSWELPTRRSPPRSRSPPLSSLSTLLSALPRVERTDPILERNVNFVPIENKTSYKAPIPSDPSAVPNRQPITPYDATEDLRAKVKLARHDLNEIKQSYLQERRERKPEIVPDVSPTPTKRREKFVTNLVPYEKNQSYKVNAVNLEDNPKNYYNYLGEKESPTKTFIPLSNAGNQRNLYFEGSHNGEVDKVAPKAPVRTKLNEKNKNEEHKTKNEEHKNKNDEYKNKNEEYKNRNEECKNEEYKSRNDENRNKARNVDREGENDRNEGSPSRKTGAVPKKVTSPNGASPEKSANNKKREQGAVPKRRKAPPPPVVIRDESIPRPTSELDEVNLPCEFCDKMIPAPQLVQHETGCRPDLAQVRAESDKPSISTARPQLSPEVELPCEFCFNLIPESKLLSHQALCDVEAN